MGAWARVLTLSTVVLVAPEIASGQQPAKSFELLKHIAAPGDIVTLLDGSGISTRGVVSAIADEELVLDVAGTARRWPRQDIREIRRRAKDSVLNGVVIGAAIGGGLNSLYYLDNECRGDPGCARLVLGGMLTGAAIGALVDALIRPNRLIYQGSGSSLSWNVGPVGAGRGWRAGVQMHWSF